MIRVRFEGASPCIGEGHAGETLLDLARRAGQPLEGICGGQVACATCHVILAAADFARVPPARGDEEDMLDFATGATRTSRLACQIVLTDALDGLTARVPNLRTPCGSTSARSGNVQRPPRI